MKILILGAQRRPHGMYGENQPDEDSRLDRECLIFERTRISRHKKQRLSIAATRRRDREPKAKSESRP
jgi:hypothetical protein